MSKHIMKCSGCGNYTMNMNCNCGRECFLPRPPKFSVEDKYGDYRRIFRRAELKQSGLY
ncbi:ribosome biogenesis protein [Candidatus Woesearchaeota archaeon]|nr:ribosome biogenesis protein [Candidatus Woesearchaeota archaeon]